VIEAYDFKRQGNIFNKYIEPIYDIKNTATDDASRQIAKLLLNSLYGMMGYNSNDVYAELSIKGDSYEFKAIENDPGHHHSFSVNVAIAAAITSYARIHMYDLRTLKSNYAKYTDTDSIIVSNQISDNLISNHELGKLRLEHKICTAAMPTLKTYAIKTIDDKIKIVASGIQHGLVNYDDIMNAAIGNKQSLNKQYKNTLI